MTTEIQIARPSVASLLVGLQFQGAPLASGTAFIAHGRSGAPYLITNRHNVTGRNQETGCFLSTTGGIPNEVVIMHNQKEALGRWVRRLEPLYEKGDPNEAPLWTEHPRLGPRADFVALKLTNTEGVDFHTHNPFEPGPELALGPADPVSVIGFPFGITAGGFLPIWATGFLASEPVMDFNDLPIQLVDCRTRKGQSGSPVIAYRPNGAIVTRNGATALMAGAHERFIGIYSGRINQESDIGMVWKASAIAELLESL